MEVRPTSNLNERTPTDPAEPGLAVERAGGVVLVTLDRPGVLNAMDLSMFRGIHDGLALWARDDSVEAVVIRGAGDRAFSAGGDVRLLHQARERGDYRLMADVYRVEYTADRLIHRFPKPWVALMDGVVMGGGCGISVNGSHRVVTERTALSMPETAIGFFPDAGATHFLSRCPGALGLYLGLTGARLGAADAIYAGLADAYVPSSRQGELIDALIAGSPADEALARFACDPGAPPLARHRAAIDRCFAKGSVKEIFAALGGEEGRGEGEWSGRTRDIMAARPPFSLAVAWRAIGAGAAMTIEDCLIMEYRVCQRFMRRDNFFEGVRAMIIDKDRKPRWRPDSLEEVDAAEVESYFKPLGEDDLVFD